MLRRGSPIVAHAMVQTCVQASFLSPKWTIGVRRTHASGQFSEGCRLCGAPAVEAVAITDNRSIRWESFRNDEQLLRQSGVLGLSLNEVLKRQALAKLLHSQRIVRLLCQPASRC
jgi:hypothetical protein